MTTKWLLSFLITLISISTISISAFSVSTKASANQQLSEFEQSLSESERVWLQSSTPIKMVYDPDWAPFEWQNKEGEHIGVISDIIETIRSKTGLNIITVNTASWAESVEMVKNGKADFFSAITVTPERKTYLNFSQNDIYSYPAVLLTQFSDSGVYLDAKHDLTGKRIGIVKSSGLGEYIRNNYPDLNYVEVPSTESGFIQLRAGKIDLFAINSVTGRYYIEKKGFDSLKIALKLDFAYSLKIAVHKDLPMEVISILDKGLESITFEEINHIVEKWIKAPTKEVVDWSITIRITTILLLVILFFVVFSKQLKRKVELKTRELEAKNRELKDALNEVLILRQREKENIYRATVHSTQHILNNLLNQLHLLDLEIKKHPDFDH